ncbi:MAG: phytanoyl-CoA dioxygenase family protein [bacterium]|nr:phytanoyl-CoA dioxygenase family protein [bacterium]
MADEPLSAQQIASYQQQGYLQVPDLLTGAEIDAFLEHEQRPKPPEIQALGLRKHTADSQWKHLAEHSRISRIVAQLLNGLPMIVQTMYMAKAPEGGTGIALHQDTHYIRNEPDTLMACWIAFSDTDKDNGGLCVASGSHLRPLYDTQPPQDKSEHASWVNEYAMRAPDGRTWSETMHSHEIRNLDPAEITFLTVPRGSGVFFTGRTIHGSYANRSTNRKRLAFATHYVKQGTWVYRSDIQDLTQVPSC